jgi:primosomal replication protein N
MVVLSSPSGDSSVETVLVHRRQDEEVFHAHVEMRLSKVVLIQQNGNENVTRI